MFLWLLAVLLIDALSEFKASVFHAVNHQIPAVTSLLGVCPEVQPAWKIQPICLFKFFLPYSFSSQLGVPVSLHCSSVNLEREKQTCGKYTALCYLHNTWGPDLHMWKHKAHLHCAFHWIYACNLCVISAWIKAAAHHIVSTWDCLPAHSVSEGELCRCSSVVGFLWGPQA